MTEAPGGGWRDGSWASDNREMLLNYLHVPQGFGAGREGVRGGKWRPEISTCLTGGVLLWNGLINCVQGYMTTWVRSYLRSQKWGVGTLSFILLVPIDRENKGYCYRWNMEWESVKNSFFFFGTSPVCGFFLFNMQTPLSHPGREIVSQAVIAGSRDDSNPISIWTITLPSGLAVHLFQFDGRGESFSLKRRAGPLYSGHWAQAGDWQTWAISEVSCCSGLNMPTPLKLAQEPGILCSPNGLPEH